MSGGATKRTHEEQNAIYNVRPRRTVGLTIERAEKISRGEGGEDQRGKRL